MIIDETALLEDSVQILIENGGFTEKEATRILSEYRIADICGVMFMAQENYLAEIIQRIRSGNI